MKNAGWPERLQTTLYPRHFWPNDISSVAQRSADEVCLLPATDAKNHSQEPQVNAALALSDYSNSTLEHCSFDPRGRAVFFVLCFACIPAAVLAVWIEVAYQARYLVHLITTPPFTLVTCILPLRPMKGWLVDVNLSTGLNKGGWTRNFHPDDRSDPWTHPRR